MMNNAKLLTPGDVADRLQVNERTVTHWLRKGQLRGFKIGKEWRVSVNDFEALLETSSNKPSSSRASARLYRGADTGARRRRYRTLAAGVWSE